MRAWPAKLDKATPRPTAFLDRDGTLNHDHPGAYITRPEQLKIYANAPAALRLMASKGYRIIVVTNQSAVGRGYMTLEASKRINLRLARALRAAGAPVDAIYFCPHAPSENCPCRKPAPGLIEEASSDLPFVKASSFVAGDKKSDLDLARNAGLRGLLVRTGQWRSLGPAVAQKGYASLLALARALPDMSRAETRKRKTP